MYMYMHMCVCVYGHHVEGQYTESDQLFLYGIDKRFTNHIGWVIRGYSWDA